MATSKSTTTVRDDVTMVAGAGDATSSSVNLTTGYGAIAHCELVNGATGPTVAGQIQIEASPDDTNWYEYGGPLVGNTDNNGTAYWNIPIDPAVQYVQFVTGSNTGQDVTMRIEVTEVTKI